MKIGITERGDASIDYSWMEKMNTVDGAILITKNVTDEFINNVMQFKDIVILHATITGFGGTVIEPNVMMPSKSLKQITKLIESGFDKNHIVVRIDPVIPTPKGIITARDVIMAAYNIGLRRFRLSVIDMYPHVIERYNSLGIRLPFDGFTASDAQFASLNKMLLELRQRFQYIAIESCAEPMLTATERIGCVSDRDAKIIGIDELPEPNENRQRSNCLCSSCKVELLNNKHRCPNKCLYCYWKD